MIDRLILDLSDRKLGFVSPHHLLVATIRILVVVDVGIEFARGIGFGVSRFVSHLRQTKVGCTRFVVDMAYRNTQAFTEDPQAGEGQARYRGYRFDSQRSDGSTVLDGYHELFLFGFQPGNDAGPDSNITRPQALPASDAELQVLHDWMNEGGGVFATGDHDYLGASMCHRIPRVGTMRKWTNAQGVPTIGGSTRLDTNQPSTPGQIAGTEVIPTTVERDGTPQPIEWVADMTIQVTAFSRKVRPHPVLCHPLHGPIDVMPDHPHEGLCFEQKDIDLSAKVNFGAGVHDEYPTVGGTQPAPRIIAYGRTVPDPPFQHEKGDMPSRRFPMISLYDGRAAHVGRVAVDSTWHHWFNMNLTGIETSGHPTNWAKISRYFVNLAVWLAPPGVYQEQCWWEILRAHFDYPFVEELHPKLPMLQKGQLLQKHLATVFGPCWVTDLVIVSLCDLDPALCRYLRERLFDRPVPCWTCPPFDLFEATILGGFVEGTEELARSIRRALLHDEPQKVRLEADDVRSVALARAREALATLRKEVVSSAKGTLESFS